MKCKCASTILIGFLSLLFSFSLSASVSEATQDKKTESFTHTVNKGETVYSIASTYNITIKDIYQLNPSAKDGLKAGDVLLIASYKSHKIAKKETLYSVATLYQITPDQLMEANEGLTASNFNSGKTIRVPQYIPQVAKKRTEIKLIKHEVKAKETLYGISKQYNVSIEDIAKSNPLLSDGLKVGMTLAIPMQVQTENNVAVKPTEKKEATKNKTTKIGVFLPFLDKLDTQRARFTEYYEGFLLAVEEMKAKGFSVDIYTFDIDSDEKLKSLLESGDIKNLNLIIGGVSAQQIAVLSEYTQKMGIKYVIPFPIKSEDVVTHDNTFIVSIPHHDFAAKAALIYANRFRDTNTVLLSDRANTTKSDFVVLLEKELLAYGIYPKTASLSVTMESDLLAELSKTKKNIIVPTSSSQQLLSRLIVVLKSIKEENPDLDIQLFGYPDWQAYTQFNTDLQRLNTTIYTPFYADNKPEVRAFLDNYKNWYGKTLLNTYPKYGLFGYDTGLFFMTAINNYGLDFDKNISKLNMSTLQTAFEFEKNSGKKGFVNTGLYFIHYADSATEKVDYNK